MESHASKTEVLDVDMTWFDNKSSPEIDKIRACNQTITSVSYSWCFMASVMSLENIACRSSFSSSISVLSLVLFMN